MRHALIRRERLLGAVVFWLFSGGAHAQTPTKTTPTDEIIVVATSPLVGSGLDRDKVPAATNVLNSADIERSGAPDALRALNEQVGGVNLDSASGNPDQPTLLYHGFQASPLLGTAQGLAVYVGGVRFNQAFGDTVNWDLVPAIAIDRIDLEGSNPVFGLNALGGSLNIRLKDGFSYKGAQADVYGGSFGKIVAEGEVGSRHGNVALYLAARETHSNGWRDLQSSNIQNLYGDLGWRGDRAEVHLNATVANSVLNGPGTSPIELLAVDPAAQFTAPNRIANRHAQASLSANYEASKAVSVQAIGYYGHLRQRVVNGNAPSDVPCNDGSGLLCSSPGVVSTTLGCAAIPDFLNGGPYAQLALQTTETDAYGVSAQATYAGALFGLKNHLIVGVSFDGARTAFDATALQGGLTIDRVFAGPGVVIDEPGVNVPVRLVVSDAFVGVFASDALGLSDAVTLTLAGRFNSARIDLSDRGGGALSGRHRYDRINPAIGATWKAAPWLTVYGGYSEANRAPTPAELSCAGPADACSLANFFTGDPDLNQVVARSYEAGLRGTLHPSATRRLIYDVSLFQTGLGDDIAFVNSVKLGRAFFRNIGATRRRGIDVGLDYKTPRWRAFVDYSHTEATYRDGFVQSAGSNPAADANGNIATMRGDRLPGVPADQLKIGASADITRAWMVGGSVVAQSAQYLFGDAANLTPKLPGFVVLNLHTRWQVTRRVQLFGMVDNATGVRYSSYGTFSPTSSVFLSQAPNATNPRSYSPAAPIGGYGGVRVTF